MATEDEASGAMLSTHGLLEKKTAVCSNPEHVDTRTLIETSSSAESS